MLTVVLLQLLPPLVKLLFVLGAGRWEVSLLLTRRVSVVHMGREGTPTRARQLSLLITLHYFFSFIKLFRWKQVIGFEFLWFFVVCTVMLTIRIHGGVVWPLAWEKHWRTAVVSVFLRRVFLLLLWSVIALWWRKTSLLQGSLGRGLSRTWTTNNINLPFALFTLFPFRILIKPWNHLLSLSWATSRLRLLLSLSWRDLHFNIFGCGLE